MKIPAGILQPTTPPEAAPNARPPRGGPASSDDGEAGPAPDAESADPRPSRARRSKVTAKGQSDKVEGRRLYLSESVHFRLRMLAYQRGQKISEVAEEVLDKALPKWDVTRSG